MKESVVETIMKCVENTMTAMDKQVRKAINNYQKTEDIYYVEQAHRWVEYATGQIDAYETCLHALTGQEDALYDQRNKLDAYKDHIDMVADFHEVEGEV